MRAPLAAAGQAALICLSVVPFFLVAPGIRAAYVAAHRQAPQVHLSIPLNNPQR